MRRAFVTAIALASFMPAAFAQNSQPNTPTANPPSSGAGVSGLPGGKSGPAVKSGTVGSSSTEDSTVRQQDATKVQGLPGNKSGPAEKQPSGR